MKPETRLSEDNLAWVIYHVDTLPANAGALSAVRVIWDKLDRFDIDRPLMRGIIRAAIDREKENQKYLNLVQGIA